MKPAQMKDKIVAALEDIKGRDIIALDVRKLTDMTDYMVIASGSSNRQVKALAENVMDEMRKDGIRPMGSEGQAAADWILVDYGDVVVHVMLPEARDFYALERLWGGVPPLAPEQEQPGN
jgi:ribosome-associated protein